LPQRTTDFKLYAATSASACQVQDCLSWKEATYQFEVITAAQLGCILKVGGYSGGGGGTGRSLGYSNVCDRPLVGIITSISPGNTGSNWGQRRQILLRRKPVSPNLGVSCWPGPLPTAEAVVRSRIIELGCPAVWPQ